MHAVRYSPVVAILSVFLSSFGCGGDDGATTQTHPSLPSTDTPEPSASLDGGGATNTDDSKKGSGDAGSPEPPPADPASSPSNPNEPGNAPPDPGPAPTATCSVEKDGDGFFRRSSEKSEYVAYVPAAYSPKAPMRVVVGLHGCGDDAMNFAKWGISPWAGRSSQQHIGISVSGETGDRHCWNIGGDDAKVLAAVDDLAKCFWVDRSKVVIAGFSSGGELAYRVGLMNASAFAGILIENSSLYAAGSTPANLLAGASWKINIAHRAHTSDSVFPIAKVRADWETIRDAGFPLETSEVAGGHDGTGDDWASWLVPKSASWVRPSGS